MNKLNRREFLRLAALAAAGTAVVACAKTTTAPATPKAGETPKAAATPTPVKAAEAKEAPALAQLVKDGKLPALNERLPVNPKILTKALNEIMPSDLDLQVGKYGGTIRTVQPSPNWQPDIFVGCDEPLLASPGILAEQVGPGVAEGFEASEGGKVFTFHMRKGLKWSDGEPVTSDDVKFMYEDVLLNEKLTPTFPSWMKTGSSAAGKPLVVEIVDDYTFKVKFEEAYAGFPAFLAILQWKGYTELLKPKHFLIKYHTTYTPLADLEAGIKAASLSAGEWWTYFWSKNANNWDLCNPKAVGFPNCQPWYVTNVGETASTYERNPYYFKVDADGQQLPYADGIFSAVVADVEMSQLKVFAGEVDFLREDATLDNFALYNENAEKGGFRVQLLDMHVSPVNVRLNQTFDNETWRSVVRDVRFRTAVSHAIDRATIIDSVYFGYAQPATTVPNEYSPEKANKLLDEMGMDKKGADGFRLAPNGQPFEIPFEIQLAASDFPPVTELVVENLKEVGINASFKVEEGGLLDQRANANEVQAGMGWDHWTELWWGALWDAYPSGWGGWGQTWQLWINTNGKQGEEPPAEVKQFVDLVNKSIVVDGEERTKTIAAWKKMMYDNVFMITVTEHVKYPLIISSKLRNVPTAGFAIAANFSLEQMYFES